MPDPLVSVVMPVHNGVSFLQEALESILAQTFDDFEFIVVDDGSTDGSRELLQDYRGRDSRVMVHERPRRGFAASLNEGCRLARGRYIARMDADDVAFSNRLERQVAHLLSRPELALLGTGHTLIDATGASRGETVYPTTTDEIAVRLVTKNCFAHPTVMFKATMLAEIGDYRGAFFPCEDYDLWLRASERFPLGNLSELLLAYRVHEEGVSSKYLRQRVISSFGAQAAARLRGAEGSDDALTSDEFVSLETLESTGVKRASVERAIFAATSTAAQVALSVADYPQALALSREALRVAVASNLASSERAPLNRIAAVASWRLGLPFGAFHSSVAGVLANPSTLLRRMRRGLVPSRNSR